MRVFLLASLLGLAAAPCAVAVSCTPQSQLTEAERSALLAAAEQFGEQIETGNVAAVRAATIASVAAEFTGISSEIVTVSPLLKGSAMTVLSLFDLDASDLTAAQDQTQFFCGGQNSPDVVFSLPQIPPGHYAVAMMHASGIAQPQQITLILALTAVQAGGGPAGPAGGAAGPGAAGPGGGAAAGSDVGKVGAWKLGGLFIRPLTSWGHDGLWYWTRARGYVRSKQSWNAYFYYQTAETLLAPVDFISTPNLDKLIKEQTAAAPEGLPGQRPMSLAGRGRSYQVTGLRTEGSLGGLDLVISYDGGDNSDPVAARTRNVEVMQAMLSVHPELRQGFHGLWVYSNAPNQRAFGNELPMSQIP